MLFRSGRKAASDEEELFPKTSEKSQDSAPEEESEAAESEAPEESGEPEER